MRSGALATRQQLGAGEVLPDSEWLSPILYSSVQGLREWTLHYVNSSGKDLRRILETSFYLKSLAEQIFGVFDNVETAVTRSVALTTKITGRKL